MPDQSARGRLRIPAQARRLLAGPMSARSGCGIAGEHGSKRRRIIKNETVAEQSAADRVGGERPDLRSVVRGYCAARGAAATRPLRARPAAAAPAGDADGEDHGGVEPLGPPPRRNVSIFPFDVDMEVAVFIHAFASTSLPPPTPFPSYPLQWLSSPSSR